MTKYTKLIDGKYLQNLTNENALNYLDEAELNNDGYKEFVPATKEEGKAYTYSYEETATQIIEHVEEIIPDYEKIRREQFYREFFNTSLGWVRRKPTLADGTEDDFLNNDLPLLAIGLMSGSNPVLPIAYRLPDFKKEFTKEYMESLQIKDQPITMQFINECSNVKMADFKGKSEPEEPII